MRNVEDNRRDIWAYQKFNSKQNSDWLDASWIRRNIKHLHAKWYLGRGSEEQNVLIFNKVLSAQQRVFQSEEETAECELEGCLKINNQLKNKNEETNTHR